MGAFDRGRQSRELDRGGDAAAEAGHRGDERSRNLILLGHIEEPRSATALFDPTAPGDDRIHTAIAFQGKTAFQGNWLGLSIRDIRNPLPSAESAGKPTILASSS
jgi:hypothetical protein